MRWTQLLCVGFLLGNRFETLIGFKIGSIFLKSTQVFRVRKLAPILGAEPIISPFDDTSGKAAATSTLERNLDVRLYILRFS
jgi:hypothetical protein